MIYFVSDANPSMSAFVDLKIRHLKSGPSCVQMEPYLINVNTRVHGGMSQLPATSPQTFMV